MDFLCALPQGDSFWRLGQLGGAASQRLSQLGQQVGVLRAHFSMVCWISSHFSMGFLWDFYGIFYRL